MPTSTLPTSTLPTSTLPSQSFSETRVPFIRLIYHISLLTFGEQAERLRLRGGRSVPFSEIECCVRFHHIVLLSSFSGLMISLEFARTCTFLRRAHQMKAIQQLEDGQRLRKA